MNQNLTETTVASMTSNFLENRQPYKLISIQRTVPPAGATGSNWYHYEISQGVRTIHGYKQGNLETVTILVEENIELLNERQIGKSGRAYLSTKSKKKS